MEPGTRSIAVVGNGPLQHAQRAEIQTFDKVVRFNALNNRCAAQSLPERCLSLQVALTCIRGVGLRDLSG